MIGAQSATHLNRVRKLYLTLANKDGEEVKKDKKKPVKSKKT
jgi:hypothetical protein